MTVKMLTFFLLVFSNWGYTQNLRVTGSFEDDNTGRDVPSRVYSINNGKKQLLGKSVQKDIFEHQFEITIPTDADSVLFENKGYASVSLPTHFYGLFQKKTSAKIRIPTLPEDKHMLYKAYLVYCRAENTFSGNKIEVRHFVNGSHHCTQDITQTISRQSLFISSEDRNESTYELVVKSAQGNVLTINEFTVRPGLNFVDTNTYPGEEATFRKPMNELTELPFTSNHDTLQEKKIQLSADSNSYTPSFHAYSGGIPAIFFDQSKYELKMDGRNTLDSLIVYLGLKTDAKITVKGFTDNVGDAALNVTLARYRAQMVANYLTANGLSPDRINIQWDETGAPLRTDVSLNLYRKVIIRESN